MNWWQTDETHDPARTSWVVGANGHGDFPVQNLPFGLFSPPDQEARIGVAIGDAILDLWACAQAGLIDEELCAACRETSVNALLALPGEHKRVLRRRISDLLTNPAHRPAVEPHLHEAADCALHLPARIGDYTDFYVGIHHANNVGRQFRPDNPLLPNYKYVPIGYHGRASSIRPSGVPVRRPRGQRKPPEAEVPLFGPSTRLDYELELGVWIGEGNALGDPIPIGGAAEHIAGFCLLNDWSARDFQAWEYQPLGPFLAKNFATTLSPWIVTLEALLPYRTGWTRTPERPQPLDYLSAAENSAAGAFDIQLEVSIQSMRQRASGRPPRALTRTSFRHLFWMLGQMIAHHTVGGCNLQPGDLLGSGTVSGPAPDEAGALIELTASGSRPVAIGGGEQRGFIEDGDTVLLRGWCERQGHARIGFGTSHATVQAARS